jgi:hypothetical protein
MAHSKQVEFKDLTKFYSVSYGSGFDDAKSPQCGNCEDGRRKNLLPVVVVSLFQKIGI